MWLFAGLESSQRLNDIWSSSNGITWIEENNQAAFPARAMHQVVCFQDRLWLMAGLEQGTGNMNDVWSSSDGIHWGLNYRGIIRFSDSP
ncbi:MAG: hypothetical protein HRU20_16805 [Pseudomonadales bacterium]|nr:hypothetical protein [Pseudomonadales bacterium]